MASVLSVIAAVATLALMTRFSTSSATALGKVSAMVSVTATFAEAWSKAQHIARQLATGTVPVPTTGTLSASKAVVRRDPDEEFLDEHPSLGLTGGIRGYDAYRPRR